MCSVETLQDDRDIHALAGLYVEAFHDNSAYRYVFPTNDEGLRWLFDRRIRMVLACGARYLVAKENVTGRILGGAGCVNNVQKPGLWSMISHGILAWPFLWGFESLSRALELDSERDSNDDWDAELVMVAVLPNRQGGGVGRQLLTELLKQIDGEGDSLTIGLKTQREINLAFYSKFGFVETSHTDSRGFQNWTMVRRSK